MIVYGGSLQHTRSMKIRRLITLSVAILLTALAILSAEQMPFDARTAPSDAPKSQAAVALEALETKGRAPKTGYAREEFGSGWRLANGCDTRQIILFRDLTSSLLHDTCTVESGTLADPYTGKTIQFNREDADAVQIDHVVALSDAWQKGAQQLTRQERIDLANDPLELLAVDGPSNQEKGDSDAASWLPPNTSFRCEYVARQIAVKQKYRLWVTPAEKKAMATVLSRCPGMLLPV